MFLGNTTTLFEKIQHDELLNYYASMHNQTVLVDTGILTNKIHNGNILFEVNLNSPYLNSLMFHQGFTNTKNNMQTKRVGDLFNNVTNELLQITECYSLTDCINIIANFVEKANNNFYGALLKNASDGTLINPLHPLVVPVILENFDVLNNYKWYPILYFYSDRKTADNIYKTSIANTEVLKVQIDCLYNATTTTPSNIQRKTLTKVAKHDNKVAKVETVETLTIIEYNQIFRNNSSTTCSILVAHQMMTEGITAPYYGTTLLAYEPGNKALGGHISPMRSCNISYEGSDENITRTKELRYTKVCTGSKASGTLEGIRTLTHANLSSPYTRRIIMDGALAYVDICISKAFQLFKLAGIIDIEVSIKDTVQENYLNLVTPEILERYIHDRLNLLEELHSKYTAAEFVEILKSIKTYNLQKEIK